MSFLGFFQLQSLHYVRHWGIPPTFCIATLVIWAWAGFRPGRQASLPHATFHIWAYPTGISQNKYGNVNPGRETTLPNSAATTVYICQIFLVSRFPQKYDIRLVDAVYNNGHYGIGKPT
jgi:hypothetical protein